MSHFHGDQGSHFPGRVEESSDKVGEGARRSLYSPETGQSGPSNKITISDWGVCQVFLNSPADLARQGSGLSDSVVNGVSDEVSVVVDAQLVHQAHLVRADGFRTEVEAVGNVAQGLAGCDAL